MAELAADAPLRKALAERAFTEVSAVYDWSRVARQVRGIYEKLVQN
jgi:glycosyltransferase involved in cell wall biosynthesis